MTCCLKGPCEIGSLTFMITKDDMKPESLYEWTPVSGGVYKIDINVVGSKTEAGQLRVCLYTVSGDKITAKVIPVCSPGVAVDYSSPHELASSASSTYVFAAGTAYLYVPDAGTAVLGIKLNVDSDSDTFTAACGGVSVAAHMSS